MRPVPTLGARLEIDVLAASAGDAHAFGRLVDQTKSTVTAVALAIVGDHPGRPNQLDSRSGIPRMLYVAVSGAALTVASSARLGAAHTCSR